MTANTPRTEPQPIAWPREIVTGRSPSPARIVSALAIIAAVFGFGFPVGATHAGEPDSAAAVDIGSRRELLVDDFLIERRDGAELRLHTPTPREVVLPHDAPWEGSGCTFCTAFRDGNRVRMWYTGADLTNEDGSKLNTRPIVYCYAESTDGIHWVKPELGLFEFQGSKRNNIIWAAPHLDNFMVFKDPNPACRPGETYKAVSSGVVNNRPVLWALKSADGLRLVPARRPADPHQGRVRHAQRRLLGPAHPAVLLLHPRLPSRRRGRGREGRARYPRGHLQRLPPLDRARVAPLSAGARRGPVHQPGPALLPRAASVRRLPHALCRPPVVARLPGPARSRPIASSA